MTIENWEERSQYIGGSEVHNLFKGEREFQNLLKIKTDPEYSSKLFKNFPEFYSRWGHEREIYMLKYLSDFYPSLFPPIEQIFHNVQDNGYWLNRAKFPFMRSTPDGLTSDYLIECKTKGLKKGTDKWKYKGVPFNYELQTLYNMLNCRRKKGVLIVEYYNPITLEILDYETIFYDSKQLKKYPFVEKCILFNKKRLDFLKSGSII